jgi:hypothetical protein
LVLTGRHWALLFWRDGTETEPFRGQQAGRLFLRLQKSALGQRYNPRVSIESGLLTISGLECPKAGRLKIVGAPPDSYFSPARQTSHIFRSEDVPLVVCSRDEESWNNESELLEARAGTPYCCYPSNYGLRSVTHFRRVSPVGSIKYLGDLRSFLGSKDKVAISTSCYFKSWDPIMPLLGFAQATSSKSCPTKDSSRFAARGLVV